METLQSMKIYDLSNNPEFKSGYSPYFVNSHFFKFRDWLPCKPDHINHIPDLNWFSGDKFKLPIVSYEDGTWIIHEGKYRLAWMVDKLKLSKIPVYISDKSIALAMIEKIIKGADRRFYDQPI
mgnify:CR=1 FL=1